MTDLPEKTIGIVAGAGPFAGLDLLGKILAQTAVSRDQDHLTIISLSQPVAITDRTAFLMGKTAVNPAHAIAHQLIQLAEAGAEVAAIPCNTAHALAIFNIIKADLAAAGCDIFLLNMIGETVRYLRQADPLIRTVGVLSTTGTAQARVYPQWLEPNGYRVVVPSQAVQVEAVHRAIYDPICGIKATGQPTIEAQQWLRLGLRDAQQQGAEVVIMGCTEIPLALTEPDFEGMPLIDPTLALARALIREAAPHKLRKWASDGSTSH